MDIPGGCRDGENLNAPLTSGLNGVRTKLTYTVLATVTVTGVGQASPARDYSDTFFVFANANGTPITPPQPNQLVPTINGQPARNFLTEQAPGVRHDHRYTFRINAPPGTLTFGVSDSSPSDNTGGYRVGRCGGTP